MITWVIIIGLGLIAAVILKVSHVKHRVTLIVLILFALFITSTASYIAVSNELDLGSTGGFVDAVKIYLGWLANGFQNLRSLTGNAIKMDWKSTESNLTILNRTIR